MALAFRRRHNGERSLVLRLRGLKPDATDEVRVEEGVTTVRGASWGGGFVVVVEGAPGSARVPYVERG